MHCRVCDQDKQVYEMHSGVKCKACHRIYNKVYHQKWLQRIRDRPGVSKCKYCDLWKLNREMYYKTLCRTCHNIRQAEYYRRYRANGGKSAQSKQGIRQVRFNGGTV